MSPLYYTLDAAGDPAPEPDVLRWAAWFEAADRTVALDFVEAGGGALEVSTVFLGLDHSFDGGIPLLFETMVFRASRDARSPDRYEDVVCRRYATRAGALDGHAEVLAAVRAGTLP